MRQSQRAELKSQFYRAFDQSKAERWLSLPDTELAKVGQLLGTGTHFTAFRIGGLVFKRALPATFAKKDPSTLRVWLEALDRARGVGELMPPFEVVRTGDAVALVMPYGDAPWKAAAPAWQPMEGRLRAFSQALQDGGLVLDDVAQGRCRGGVPFIYDLSDLRLKG